MFRTQNVRSELPRPEQIDEFMAMAMRRYLVTRACNFTHELRAFLSHPAEHEERRAGMAIIEYFDDPRRVPLNSQFALLPCLARDSAFKVFDVEPILDVDRQCRPLVSRPCRSSLHRPHARHRDASQQTVPASAKLLHVLLVREREVARLSHIDGTCPGAARLKVEQDPHEKSRAFALRSPDDPVERIERLNVDRFCCQYIADIELVGHEMNGDCCGALAAQHLPERRQHAAIRRQASRVNIDATETRNFQ